MLAGRFYESNVPRTPPLPPSPPAASRAQATAPLDEGDEEEDLLADDLGAGDDSGGLLGPLKKQIRLLSRGSPSGQGLLAPSPPPAHQQEQEQEHQPPPQQQHQPAPGWGAEGGAAAAGRTPATVISTGYADSHNPGGHTRGLLRTGGTTSLLDDTGSAGERAAAPGPHTAATTMHTHGTSKLLAVDMTMASSVGAEVQQRQQEQEQQQQQQQEGSVMHGDEVVMDERGVDEQDVEAAAVAAADDVTSHSLAGFGPLPDLDRIGLHSGLARRGSVGMADPQPAASAISAGVYPGAGSGQLQPRVARTPVSVRSARLPLHPPYQHGTPGSIAHQHSPNTQHTTGAGFCGWDGAGLSPWL